MLLEAGTAISKSTFPRPVTSTLTFPRAFCVALIFAAPLLCLALITILLGLAPAVTLIVPAWFTTSSSLFSGDTAKARLKVWAPDEVADAFKTRKPAVSADRNFAVDFED